MSKMRVGVNGYGTIGTRVTDAVTLQDDMELVVADIATHCRVRTAIQRATQSMPPCPIRRYEPLV